VDKYFLCAFRVAAFGFFVANCRKQNKTYTEGGAAGFGADLGCYWGWVVDVEADSGSRQE
jgi:hypothetical protein